MRGTCVALLALPMVVLAAPAAPDPVRRCMSANLPQTLRVQEFEVTTWDRAGQERVMKGRLFGARADDRRQLMGRIEHPGDLAGTSFLVRDAGKGTEMYVYLPGVNRVKRLAGSHMHGKLWGTDFSYNEFRRVADAFADGQATMAAAPAHQGRAVHDMTLTPAAGAQDPYDRIRVLVDAQTCVPLHAEFRKGPRTRKVLTVPAETLRQAGGHWYAGELVLRDIVAGTRTRLRVLGVTSGLRLSKGYFHPRQFHAFH